MVVSARDFQVPEPRVWFSLWEAGVLVFAIVEVGKFPVFTHPIEAGSEWGTHNLSQQESEQWGISSSCEKGFLASAAPSTWHPSGLSVPWVFATPTLQDQTCLQTGGLIWTKLRLWYHLFGLFPVFGPGSAL